MLNVGGTLYFTAADPTSGEELWKSDGTEVGTVQVSDIVPGLQGSQPRYLTAVGGNIYFLAFDATQSSRDLWKSNGTASGTTRVKVLPGFGARYLTNVNGAVFFRAGDFNTGYELWKSDGTEAGTAQLKDISAAPMGSNPSRFYNANGTLFFVANDAINGYELWKSDGTAAGTVLVKDIESGPSGAFVSFAPPGGGESWVNIGSTLYFKAGMDTELWKSDGTSAGTQLVADINSGSIGSDPRWLTNVNGTLYFMARNSAAGDELWKSDGTLAGTLLVKDIYPGGFGSVPYSIANVNGTVYFSANDGVLGSELWKSDGTSAGTVLVEDLSLAPLVAAHNS